MLPRDFQTPFSFRVLNVSASLKGSTLTTWLNPTNLIHILYMTFVLEQTWCPAFQVSGGIMPSSLFIRSNAQIPELAKVQPIHMLPITEGKCRMRHPDAVPGRFQIRLLTASLCVPSSSSRDGMVLVQFLAWIFSWWVRTTQSLGFKESKWLHMLPEQC